MQQLNVVGFETRFGFRTIELYHGDITALSPRADVLVVSAFAGGYTPNVGSVFGGLFEKHAIDAQQLSRTPELDLRAPLGVWLSRPLSVGPATRLLCVHLRGGDIAPLEALDNVFASIMLFAAKGVPTSVVALPLLGAGHQQLNPDTLVGELVSRARTFLERALATDSLRFVEIDLQKAKLIADSMDRVLGRLRVTVPQATLTAALLEDVRNKLALASTLFVDGATELRLDWIRLLQQEQIRTIDFGVQARKLVELILTRLDVDQQPLYKRIHALEQRNSVAPWICGYMHVLRHLGNESAHQSIAGATRIPSAVGPSDLTAGLYCVERLLEFWLSSQAHGTT